MKLVFFAIGFLLVFSLSNAFGQDVAQVYLSNKVVTTEIVGSSETDIFTKDGNFSFSEIKKIVLKSSSQLLIDRLNSKTDLEIVEEFDEQTDFSENNNEPEFSTSISGFVSALKNSDVRFLDFALNADQEKSLIANPQLTGLYDNITNYFKKEFGLEAGIITENQRSNVYQNVGSICTIMVSNVTIGEFESQFMAVGYIPMTISFYFCNQEAYKFDLQLNVNGTTASFDRPVSKAFDRLFNGIRPEPRDNQITIPSNEIVVPFDDSEILLASNDLESFEGAYELISTTGRMPIKKLGLKVDNGVIKIVHIENNFLKDDWIFGEYRGELEVLRANSIFKGRLLGNYKTPVEIVCVLDANGFLEIENLAENQKYRFVKYDFIKSAQQR